MPGTCTVLVSVSDENDVAPRWASTEWNVEVDEGQPTTAVLAVFSVTDPDLHNNLTYRVSNRFVCYRDASGICICGVRGPHMRGPQVRK